MILIWRPWSVRLPESSFGVFLFQNRSFQVSFSQILKIQIFLKHSPFHLNFFSLQNATTPGNTINPPRIPSPVCREAVYWPTPGPLENSFSSLFFYWRTTSTSPQTILGGLQHPALHHHITISTNYLGGHQQPTSLHNGSDPPRAPHTPSLQHHPLRR
jgi:hypothetical protein